MESKGRKAELAQERAARIAEQMRDNLKKRKAQKRARTKSAAKGDDG